MRRPKLAGRVSGSTSSPRDQLQVVGRDRHVPNATAVSTDWRADRLDHRATTELRTMRVWSPRQKRRC